MTYKYQALVKVLDRIISDAPEKLKKKRYSISGDEVNRSRSLAYIHLYLMARHGVTSFEARDQLITDGSYDGGLDAYYIDNATKVISVIQAKFRTTSENFSDKKIDADELLAMDLSRISRGEECDSYGNKYNGKILGFQRALKQLKSPGAYEWKVIILANTDYKKEYLDKLTGGFESEVFDYAKAYSKLLFPVISGNYYDPDELEVSINLANAQHPRIQYDVDLGEMKSNITVLFVPTLEIAKVLHKYKNSILKYNPRSYLEMRRNSVNDEIKNTIVNCDNNEFALFNNGITIISSDCFFCDRIGIKNKASLSLKMPQIINGGQTAFTLSRIYEQCITDGDIEFTPFIGKEVLVKIISFPKQDEDTETGYSKNVIELIEKISKATNSQNPIDAADKRANDDHHIKFQAYVFDKAGLFYERKRGEFADGIKNHYISRDLLIKRDDLIRCCLASENKAGEARRANKKHLFSDSVADQFLARHEKFESYVSAYICYQEIKNIEAVEKTSVDKYSQDKYGNAFRYGKYAVVSAFELLKGSRDSISLVDVLKQWVGFEEFVKNKHKDKYFKTDNNMLNYYKSNDVTQDISDFFKNSHVA